MLGGMEGGGGRTGGVPEGTGAARAAGRKWGGPRMRGGGPAPLPRPPAGMAAELRAPGGGGGGAVRRGDGRGEGRGGCSRTGAAPPRPRFPPCPAPPAGAGWGPSGLKPALGARQTGRLVGHWGRGGTRCGGAGERDPRGATGPSEGRPRGNLRAPSSA